MKNVKFKVSCVAIYTSELPISDEIADNKKSILEYIHNHLSECNIENLEWINDLDSDDAVTQEDICYVY